MYNHEIIPSLQKILNKLSKKDKSLYLQVLTKIQEVIHSSQVEHYKNLRYDMKDRKRVHIGHHVLVFNFIPDENTLSPVDQASKQLLKDHLEEVLGTLSEREAKVLKLRFGLEQSKAMTLEEVGKVFGVTRERIRQIEAKALRKLKHPSRRKKLQDYLD